MGCSSSRNTTMTSETPGRLRRRKSWRSMQLMTPNSADRRLVMALQDLKKQMDEDQFIYGEFSFTKIILRLGTIERVLKSVKAVFRSVDHGNKGHVTRNELKEGLHKAKVDLGEEWEDTNIDDCLEHLGDSGGGGGDHDRVGLREFVVMLAVGRVCRPQKRRSSIFVPIRGIGNSGSGIGNSGSDIGNSGSGITSGGGEEISVSQRKERPPPTMKTINEDESRRGSMASSELAEVDDKAADEAPVATVGGQAGGEGGGGGAGEGPPDEEGNGVPCMDHVSAARSKEAIEAGVPQLRASAGPGGLPRGNSWRNLMWARIPPLRSLDVSGRSMRGITRTRSSSVLVKGTGGGAEGDVSARVKYVLDLFIAAYFQFDTKAQGYIAKSTLEQKLRQAERESATSSLLDEKRWSELAWEDDRLSFREFIYAFAQWLGLPEDDDDEISVLSQSGHDTGRLAGGGNSTGIGIAGRPTMGGSTPTAVGTAVG